ncbi:hypothetical protein GCM10009836_17180 [Pseudonocardia ailaonensis]|uniref:DUF3558 domain-containing protein n=1 Tax=Pseudonocardia ailaonensis TaxID=367279 RepID=A0ABN2MVD9_9PSEU
MSEQPQGPGWWQATDGRWYPPQQQPYPPQQQYPQQQYPQQQYGQQQYYPQQYAAQPGQRPPSRGPKLGRGCVVVVVVVAVLLVAGIGAAVYFVNRGVNAVKDVAGGVANGGTFGQAKCPTEQDVSSIVGSKVTLVLSGNVVVASGCSYMAVDRTAGANVQITKGFALAADDQFSQLASDAATQGTTPSSISVGDKGEAFGGPGRSNALAVAGDSVILVEIFNAGSADIGDKEDAAVSLLKKVIAER